MNFAAVRAVLFDVDGTLFSSEEIIHQVYIEEFSRTQRDLGRPAKIPGKSEIIAEIGKPVPVIFRNLAPDLTQAEQDEVSARILEGLVRHILAGEGHHYPGAKETIRDLHARGFRLFTASNGREPYVRSILEANKVIEYFSGLPVIGGRITNKTELVSDFLLRESLSPAQAILVGDRASDRDAALDNGVCFAACRFGHGTPAEWEGAAAFLDNITDLSRLLPSKLQ